MIKINDIKCFITNDFKSATISGKLFNGELVTNLKMKKNPSFATISVFGTDINSLRKDEKACVNVLLDYFLENNYVTAVKYNGYSQYYRDSYVIEILGSKNLTLAFENVELLVDTFPNLIKKVEEKRKLDTLNEFIENLNSVRHLSINKYSNNWPSISYVNLYNCTNEIVVDEYGLKSYKTIVVGQQCYYHPLYIIKNGKNILYEGELQFIEKLVYEFLNKHYISTPDITYEQLKNYNIDCSKEIFESVVKNVIGKLYNENIEKEKQKKLILGRQENLWMK